MPLVSDGTAHAQAAQPSLVGSLAPRQKAASARVIAHAPVLDGRLDDAAWKDVEALADFVQREPSVGQPATERTEVRIVTDGQAFYVGAWLYDRGSAGIVSGDKVRDVELSNSDYFAFILDTFRDRQNGFVFGTTPSGIEYDGQVTREGVGGGGMQPGQSQAQVGAIGGFNLNWDGSWSVATSVDSLGWYAEFRIPFTTLRHAGEPVQTWGLNMVRLIRRKNEEVFWSLIPRQFNLYRLSLAGSLDSIRVPERRVATLTPYLSSSARRDTASRMGFTQGLDFGADAKYGLTPSLTLDVTYNTDFAQVEVDDQRANLTRFPLFFPEKRPFFLENAGIFNAGTPQSVELFFSRRIGIDTGGRTLPLLGGARVTGHIGGTTVGLLQMLTNSVATQRGQSYTVARVLREMGRRSQFGLIALQRVTRDSADDHNRTYGFDGRVGLGDAVTIDWWGAKTETPRLGRDDYGYSGMFGYSTNDWNIRTRTVRLGADFNPELGFLNRSGGYRYFDGNIERLVRKKEWTWMRVWNPHIIYRSFHRLDGYLQSSHLHVDFIKVEFSDGGRFGPELNIDHEGLQQPFQIAPGVTLPVGSYDFTGFGFDWWTNPSAPLSMVLRRDFGPFYNGRRNGTNVRFTFRRGATWTSSLLVDHNDVHLARGDFARLLIGARFAYFFTPRISAQALTQYDDQQRVWSANARLSWLNTAGTGLFVVFNDGEEADGFFRWVRPQTRQLTVKYTRQLGRASDR